jgi:hypothetical protein
MKVEEGLFGKRKALVGGRRRKREGNRRMI